MQLNRIWKIKKHIQEMIDGLLANTLLFEILLYTIQWLARKGYEERLLSLGPRQFIFPTVGTPCDT